MAGKPGAVVGVKRPAAIPTRPDLYPLLSTLELMEYRSDPDKWIVPDMIPKVGRVIFWGKGGEYKTFFAVEMAIAVAGGKTFMGGSKMLPVQGPAVVISTEGSVSRYIDRIASQLRARNLHPGALELHHGRKRLDLGSPKGINALRAIIEATKPVFVVLDPLVNFTRNLSERSNDDYAILGQNVDELIEEYQFCLVVIHHSKKDGTDIRGPSYIQGWVDTSIKFETNRKREFEGLDKQQDIVLIEACKQRDGTDGLKWTFAPVIDDESGMSACVLYDDIKASSIIRVHQQQRVYVAMRKAARPLTRSEIRAEAGCGSELVNAAVDALAELGLIRNVEARRATSAEGGRTRPVEAWEARSEYSAVDVVRALLTAQGENPEHGPHGISLDERSRGGGVLDGAAPRPQVRSVR